jgi:O-antigen/teichoic acid export membrane protein
MAYQVGGQFIYVLAQLAILAALTNLRGAEAVGEFGLALALTTPFFMFASMGSRSSQASDVSKRYSFAEYGGLILALALLATLASLIASVLFALSGSSLLLVAVISLTKVAEAVSLLSYGAFQQAGRPDKIAASLVMRAAGTVPLFLLLLWLGAPLGVAFLAQLLVWTAIALVRDYPLATRIAAGRFVWPSREGERLLKLAREIGPLSASHGINGLLNSLPRLYVERTLGLSAVGVLTVITYFQQAGTMLMTSVGLPLVNRFARLWQSGDTGAIRRTLLALLILILGCSVSGILLVAIAGRWVLSTFFGPELAGAHDLLLVIAFVLSAQLFNTLFGSLMHADRQYTTFLYREIAAVIVCAFLLAVFVPRLGLTGAVYAILGAVTFRLAVIAIAAIRILLKQAGKNGAPAGPEARVT